MFVDDLLHLIVEQLDVVVDSSTDVDLSKLYSGDCRMSFWKAAMSMRRMSRYWYLATVGGSHGTCKRQVTRSWSLKHVGWTATRDRKPVSLADVNNKSSVILIKNVTFWCV